MMFVYLDNSATTRQYDQVTQLMMRLMKEDYGNRFFPSPDGCECGTIREGCPKIVASSLGAGDDEIVFTGSGTEADNMAIFGVWEARKRRGNKIITSKAEPGSYGSVQEAGAVRRTCSLRWVLTARAIRYGRAGKPPG